MFDSLLSPEIHLNSGKKPFSSALYFDLGGKCHEDPQRSENSSKLCFLCNVTTVSSKWTAERESYILHHMSCAGSAFYIKQRSGFIAHVGISVAKLILYTVISSEVRESSA